MKISSKNSFAKLIYIYIYILKEQKIIKNQKILNLSVEDIIDFISVLEFLYTDLFFTNYLYIPGDLIIEIFSVGKKIKKDKGDIKINIERIKNKYFKKTDLFQVKILKSSSQLREMKLYENCGLLKIEKILENLNFYFKNNLALKDLLINTGLSLGSKRILL
jgi:hypothetical protein